MLHQYIEMVLVSLQEKTDEAIDKRRGEDRSTTVSSISYSTTSWKHLQDLANSKDSPASTVP